MSLPSIPLQRLRETIASRVEASSLRTVARQVGMSPMGLKKFILGQEPYSRTQQRLLAWWLREVTGTVPAEAGEAVEAARDRPGGAPVPAAEPAALAHAHPVADRTAFVTAADFKTHCLRLIEEVRQGRGNVVITRYGTPVARLVPYDQSIMSLFGHLSGTVVSHGDLISPVDEPWEADA
jgi:prevent-host-death family protein